MGKKLTKNIFINRSNEIHKNKYDYTQVIYLNTTKKVHIICPEHGKFEQSPGKHLKGQGCRRCSKHPVFDTPSFIEDSIKIHGVHYDYSKVKYIKSNLKVKIICPIHGEFEQRPSNHLNGQGCGICGVINTGINQRGNTKKFIIDSKKIHGDYYDYSKVNYIKNNLKVTIICPTHGEFTQIPNTHLLGRGCLKCGYKKVSNKTRLPFKTFLLRSKRVHGKTYDYDEETYTTYTKKMKMICSTHGEFYQTPHSHISMSTGCKKCGYNKLSNKNRLTQDEFVNRSINTHGNLYDYSKSKYINSGTKVSIMCNEHGVFEQLPFNHINGQGCRKCGYESSSNKTRLTNKQFIFKSQEIHGDIYDYSLTKYHDSHTDVKIICPTHGLFEQNPHSHKRGSGCPKCFSSHGERIIRNLLSKRKIKFEEQKTFDWLKSKSKLRCDFYLPKYKTVIEYNGIQHYKINDFFGGKSSFLRGKERDKIKRKLLSKNNVKLIEVRFDEKDIENYIFNQLSI